MSTLAGLFSRTLIFLCPSHFLPHTDVDLGRDVFGDLKVFGCAVFAYLHICGRLAFKLSLFSCRLVSALRLCLLLHQIRLSGLSSDQAQRIEDSSPDSFEPRGQTAPCLFQAKCVSVGSGISFISVTVSVVAVLRRFYQPMRQIFCFSFMVL